MGGRAGVRGGVCSCVYTSASVCPRTFTLDCRSWCGCLRVPAGVHLHKPGSAGAAEAGRISVMADGPRGGWGGGGRGSPTDSVPFRTLWFLWLPDGAAAAGSMFPPDGIKEPSRQTQLFIPHWPESLPSNAAETQSAIFLPSLNWL